MIDTDEIKVGRKLTVVDTEGKAHKAEVERIWHERAGFDVRLETCPATRNGFRGIRADGLVYDFYMQEAETGDYGLTLVWSEPEAPAQPFTLLDDAGRAALKAGDRVLVEVTVQNAEVDQHGDISVEQDFGAHGPHQYWAKPSAVYALLAPAPKPIAVGDTVRISAGLTGATGKVLAFTSAGVPVVEFVDGDGLTARTFDASCLEVVS